MKPLILLATQSLLIAGLGFSQTVYADSTRVNCEFTKSGDRVNNASGDCTFSQRRGDISITLRNGDSYELRAANGNSGNNGNNGKASYANWKNRDSGQCIAVRTEKGKIRSLVYATDYDCTIAK